VDLTKEEESKRPKWRIRKLLAEGLLLESSTLEMLESSPKGVSPPLALEALAAYESDSKHNNIVNA
jgi:hypothetical protein